MEMMKQELWEYEIKKKYIYITIDYSKTTTHKILQPVTIA